MELYREEQLKLLTFHHVMNLAISQKKKKVCFFVEQGQARREGSKREK